MALHAHASRLASFRAFTLLAVLGAAHVGTATINETSKPTGDRARERAVESYGNLPLSFEANQGQTDSRVKFVSRGRGYTLFLTGNEAVLALRKAGRWARQDAGQQAGSGMRQLAPALLGPLRDLVAGAGRG